MAKRRKVRFVSGPPVSGRKAIKRRSVRQKMPSQCFLLPKERKFPVCPASVAKTGKVVYDVKLIRAAITRAAQHGYPEVERKARRLLARAKAQKKGKKRKRRK